MLYRTNDTSYYRAYEGAPIHTITDEELAAWEESERPEVPPFRQIAFWPPAVAIVGPLASSSEALRLGLPAALDTALEDWISACEAATP